MNIEKKLAFSLGANSCSQYIVMTPELNNEMMKVIQKVLKIESKTDEESTKIFAEELSSGSKFVVFQKGMN